MGMDFFLDTLKATLPLDLTHIYIIMFNMNTLCTVIFNRLQEIYMHHKCNLPVNADHSIGTHVTFVPYLVQFYLK